MLIRIGFEIVVDCPKPTPMLLALRTHPSYDRPMIGSDHIRLEPETRLVEYNDALENKRARILAPKGTTTLWSDCVVEDSGLPDAFDWNARQHEVMDLPIETLPFVTASRYCQSDELVDSAWAMFGSTPQGWARAAAISNWVHNHVMFGYQFGRPTKTAADVSREGTGVCRDFAHLFIALCRAMNIPARYTCGYLSDIGVVGDGVDDFCAWSEVFLEGRWHIFDARHNVPRLGRIPMARGRDAADVAMVTAFGNYQLIRLQVWCVEMKPAPAPDILKALQTRPAVGALVLENTPQRLPI